MISVGTFKSTNFKPNPSWVIKSGSQSVLDGVEVLCRTLQFFQTRKSINLRRWLYGLGRCHVGPDLNLKHGCPQTFAHNVHLTRFLKKNWEHNLDIRSKEYISIPTDCRLTYRATSVKQPTAWLRSSQFTSVLLRFGAVCTKEQHLWRLSSIPCLPCVAPLKKRSHEEGIIEYKNYFYYKPFTFTFVYIWASAREKEKKTDDEKLWCNAYCQKCSPPRSLIKMCLPSLCRVHLHVGLLDNPLQQGCVERVASQLKLTACSSPTTSSLQTTWRTIRWRRVQVCVTHTLLGFHQRLFWNVLRCLLSFSGFFPLLVAWEEKKRRWEQFQVCTITMWLVSAHERC